MLIGAMLSISVISKGPEIGGSDTKKREVACAVSSNVCSYLKIKAFNYIPSSEFNAYLKQINVILSAVKKYRIFSLVANTIYIFFTVANKGCFDNLGLNFLQKRSGIHYSCLTLRYGRSQVK